MMQRRTRTRLVLILAALIGLSGCYQPLYGNKPIGSVAPSPQEAALNNVSIASIPERNGQKLRNFLIDRFYSYGRPQKTDFELVTRLTVVEEKLGLQKDATTTRARLNITASYTLTDTRSHKVILTSTSHTFVSYSVLDQEYANLSERENAADRGLKEIAELMTTRVLLALEEGK